MKYYLVNNGKYIAKNENSAYYIVTDITKAVTFRSKTTANHFLTDNAFKKISAEDGWSIIPKDQASLANELYKDDVISVTVNTQVNTNTSDISSNNMNLIVENVPEYKLDFDLDSFIKDTYEKVFLIEKRNKYLNQCLSNFDIEQNKIEERAEKSILNAAEGYALYKELRGNAIKRRDVKDEMSMIKSIHDHRFAKELFQAFNTLFSIDVSDVKSKVALTGDDLGFDLTAFIKDIQNKSIALDKREKYLEFALTRAEREMVDLRHAAEFLELSASNGYKLYKKLHDVMVEKRQIIEEIEKINMAKNKGFTEDNTKKILDNFESMKKRTYVPRELDYLFKN